MDILDFLEETADYWNPAEFKKADEDAQKLSADAWIKKYGNKIMANKDLAADFYNLKNFKPLPERLSGSFGDMQFNPSEAWKQQIYQSEYKDVPREEFEKVLSNMRKYYLEEEARKDSIKAYHDRKKEIEDWPLYRQALASDYEKQRYLNDPKSAIFGDQAPGFIGSSTGAKSDLLTGLAAGAADIATPFIPVPGINIIANALVGPGIRASRDVAHKVSDSPYQKDWTDIATNFGADAGLNLFTAGTANARGASRVLSNVVDPNVKSAFELSITADNIKKGLKNVTKASNTDEFIDAVRAIPDSPMKAELISTIDYTGKGVDVAKARDIIKAYERDIDPSTKALYKSMGPGGVANAKPTTFEGRMTQAMLQEPKPTGYINQILAQPELNTLGKRSQYGMLRGMDKINLGSPGTAGFEALYTAKGRGTEPKYKEDPEEFERKKRYYKETRGEDWLKFGKALAPKEQEGDPAWEAYKEVMGIK